MQRFRHTHEKAGHAHHTCQHLLKEAVPFPGLSSKLDKPRKISAWIKVAVLQICCTLFMSAADLLPPELKCSASCQPWKRTAQTPKVEPPSSFPSSCTEAKSCRESCREINLVSPQWCSRCSAGHSALQTSPLPPWCIRLFPPDTSN